MVVISDEAVEAARAAGSELARQPEEDEPYIAVYELIATNPYRS